MKKYIITFLLLFTATFLFAQDNVFKASWITIPVRVDGSGEDWSQPLRYYDADTKLFFAFENDDKNLYLCFQTTDNMNKIKIMHAGMEISLGVKGEHKASIDFPLEQSTDLSQNNMAEVKGFATRNGMISLNDSSGINIAINHEQSNKFVYEVSVPLKELFGANYTADDISKYILMDVKINAMKGQSHPENSTAGNNFSGRGGGGRMSGGGGMHHNRNAGNASNADTNAEEIKEDKTDMSKKTEFKQKFVLAQNNATKK